MHFPIALSNAENHGLSRKLLTSLCPLAVGTNTGDVAVWDLRQSEKKVEMRFKSQIVHDSSIAINRAVWSPEGRLIGAAFSKRVVHVFSYNPTVMEVALHLEVGCGPF